MNSKYIVIFAAVSLFVAAAAGAPVITSFSPTFGSPSSPNFIVINGSGFTGGALQVRFGGPTGALATTAVVTMDTQIQVLVPATAQLGPQPIYVQVGGFAAVSGSDFTVIPSGRPFVAGFTPPFGNNASLVTITGAQFFVPGPGFPTVRFNDVPGTVNVASDSQIQATPPFGVTTGPITVTSGNQSHTSAQKFYVNPVITGFSPSSGRSGTNVMIRGTNFTDAVAVKFNGVPAVFFVTNNNVIGAIVPPGVTAGPIRVETPHINPAVTTSNFTVAPTILNFTPIAGTIGASVSVTGANFNVPPVTVRFGNVQAAAPTGVTFSNLTVVVPAGATNGAITVTTAHGSHTSSELFHLPPLINSISPNTGPPGTTVHISGTNFLGTTAVTFNGVAASEFFVTNNNSIGAIVPPAAVSGPLTLTTPAGTSNSAPSLFFALPAISSFNPTHGLPGTNVQILGVNFTGTTAVQFSGVDAPFTVAGSGEINAVVPTNAVTGPITIVAPGGQSDSDADFVLDYTSDVGVRTTAPASNVLGNDFTYVLSVTNRGPFTAPNVTLTNLLPGSVLFRFGSTTRGSLITSGNPIIAQLGSMNAGSSATVTLTVTPQVIANITNVATIAAGHEDPVSTNNVSVAVTRVFVVPEIEVTPVASGSQLRISWSAALADLVLEYTESLSSNTWTVVTTDPEFIGNQKVVTEPIGPGIRFYRLRSDQNE